MARTPATFVGEDPRLEYPLARRFARAFVVSLALVGVVAYAQGFEDEETLAGAATALEEIEKPDTDTGVCPPKFPVEVHVKGGHPADKNGDLVICTDEKGDRFVDNDYVAPVKGERQVNGHGNFFDGGKKLMQDISFSFHAINTGDGSKGFSDAAKGEFEFHDQTPAGPDLTVHGDVLCLSAGSGTAFVIGRVTRSNDASLPVDALIAWVAEDNGEGINEPVDRVSRPVTIGGKLPSECRAKVPELPLRLIVGGNIQVH